MLIQDLNPEAMEFIPNDNNNFEDPVPAAMPIMEDDLEDLIFDALQPPNVFNNNFMVFEPPSLQRHVANAVVIDEQQATGNIINDFDLSLDLSFLDDIDSDPIATEPFIYPFEYLAPAVNRYEYELSYNNFYISPPSFRRRNCPN